MKQLISAFILIFIGPFSKAQDYADTTLPVDSRVESLLNALTLDEKLSLIGGTNTYFIRSIPSLGLPEIKMSDGPVGVRTWGPSTAYPAGICNASTWDRELIYKLGQSLGKDARARGVNILLGPGLNIYRAPMCGRNFEYFGEDPYLAGQTAVQFVDGVQSEGVVATVKHFAGNNEEWNRFSISSDIDERTLQEIYLPAFRAAVTQGHAGAVMNAYNLLNGIYCTQNRHLNMDILKGQWGFKGVLMSDWGATHAGLAAAHAGLDLEMPSANFMNPDTLKLALYTGGISDETIDDKVRRILRMIFTFGFYDHPQTDTSIPLDDPDNDSVALELAREGIVLLKNDSVLPLDTSIIKSLAVIGPNADVYTAGGGSSYTTPFHYISALQGIGEVAGKKLKINWAGSLSAEYFALNSVFYSAPGSGIQGLTGEYFNNQNLSGNPVALRIDTVIDFQWPGAPDVAHMPSDHFSVRWTGVIRPDSSLVYTFFVKGDDGFRLWVNGQKIIDNWIDESATTVSGNVYFTKGTEDSVRLEYYEDTGDADISMGYRVAGSVYKEVANSAAASDAAVVCVGFNNDSEQEGMDRSFDLGKYQDSLINLVSAINPNTVVIINAGGNVDMHNWIGKVKGLIQAWYPGQDGGKALAEILFGITNPSGKLPVSFEKNWRDNPASGNYYANDGPADVKYNEGIFLGYRYYETFHVKPLFPFGFGLSYTTFDYSGLKISNDSVGNTRLTFDIKNTGSRAGAEIAELYVSPEAAKITRPVKELKNYAREFLLPGEIKTINMTLDPSAFSYFDVHKNSFTVDKGNYDLIIGSSSEDERLRGTVAVSSLVITGFENMITGKNNLSVYPNPADDYIMLQLGKSPGAINYFKIYTINGKQVDEGKFTGMNYRKDISLWPDGLYIIGISSGNSVSVKRFLIIHRQPG